MSSASSLIILPILGLVTPKEAISGLSSNAVVSIIAVIIIGAGLDKTGVMNFLARVFSNLPDAVRAGS